MEPAAAPQEMTKVLVCFKWQGSLVEIARAWIHFGAADDDVYVSARMLQYCVVALCSQFVNPQSVMIYECSGKTEISPRPGVVKPWAPAAETLKAWQALRAHAPATTIVLIVSTYSLKAMLVGCVSDNLIRQAIKFQSQQDQRCHDLYNQDQEEARGDWTIDDGMLWPHGREEAFPEFDSDDPALSARAKNLILHDRHVACAAVAKQPCLYKYLSDELRSNVEITVVALEACEDSGHVLEHAPPSIQSNKDVVIKSADFEFASAELKSDKAFVLEYLKRPDTRCCLRFVAGELRNDPDVLLAVATAQTQTCLTREQEGFGAIFFYTPQLMRDKTLLLKVLQVYGMLLAFAPADVKADKELVLAAVTNTGLALQSASLALRKDKAVVLAAVTENGAALKWAHPSLKNNYGVVSAAVASKPYVLLYASKRLRRCPVLMFEAAKKNGRAFAKAQLKSSSRKLVFAALSSSGGLRMSNVPLSRVRAIMEASSCAANQYDVVAAAIAQAPDYLAKATYQHRSNKQIVLRAVSKAGWVLRYAAKELTKDKDVVLAAVRNHGKALQFASDMLRNDDEVCMAAVAQDGGALQYASIAIQGKFAHVHMAMSSLRSNWLDIVVAMDLRRNKQIALAAVRKRGKNLATAVDEHQADWEVVHAAAVQNIKALRYARRECIMSKVVD